MKKILVPILCSAAVLFASCNQDLLEIPQKGVVTTDTFYKSDADAEAAMVAAYQGLIWNVCSQEGGSTYSPYRQAFNQCGDDILGAGEFWGDNDHIFCMNEFRHDAACNPTANTYKNIYYAMYYSNLVIDKFKDGLPGGEKTATTKRVVAEARVLRAWMHMTLALGWGCPPLVDHLLGAAELPTNCDLAEKPMTHEELLKWCANECKEAYDDLDERKSPTDKDGAVKVTKGFAKAVEGKCLVFAGDFAGAKSALKTVIDSKKYALVPGNRYKENFHIEGDANEEKVFETNVEDTNPPMAGAPWEGSPSIMNRTTWMESNLWNWRSDHFVANPSTAYSSIDGWGGLGVPESFAAEFIANDGLDSYRLQASIVSIEDIIYKYSYPGLKDESGKLVDDMTPEERKTCKVIGIGEKGLYGQCAYLPLKPITTVADLKNPGNNLRMNNYTIMRYAEVLLLYAEACLQTNDANGAKEAINQISERACGKTYASVTMDDLKREKKLEMWLEGCRWPDMVRWKDFGGLAHAGENIPSLWDAMFVGEKDVKATESAHRFYITHSNPSKDAKRPYGFDASKHTLFPYPEDVVAINPNLKQNPGW